MDFYPAKAPRVTLGRLLGQTGSRWCPVERPVHFVSHVRTGLPATQLPVLWEGRERWSQWRQRVHPLCHLLQGPFFSERALIGGVVIFSHLPDPPAGSLQKAHTMVYRPSSDGSENTAKSHHFSAFVLCLCFFFSLFWPCCVAYRILVP